MVTNDIRYIGVNDHEVDLFEGQYVVPSGMSYNSYAILDEKIAIMDTVDNRFVGAWLENIRSLLGDREPDFLVVQHMEPDHSAGIDVFLNTYPNAQVVSSAKAFAMMKNFFGSDYEERRVVVGEGSQLALGKHTLTSSPRLWFTGPRSSCPTIPATRCCSLPTASASSARWM
jgi:flavorubredoxin